MLKPIAKHSLVAFALLTTSLVASDILVTVNGKHITKQDANTFVSAAQPNMTYDTLNDEQKKLIKERLVEKALFVELARKEDVDESKEFKKGLEKIQNELMVNVWMKQQMESVVVSDSEAKEFYEKNKKKFVQPESARARHILVKEEAEAKKIAKEYAKLSGKQLEEKFIALAESKSTGPSAKNGGDLGAFTKEQMVPEFSKAVWALDVGKASTKPVKTQFGYHLIYLEAKNAETTLSYSEVKPNIVASLKQKQFTEKIATIAKELKKKADIEEPKK
jgi:peptidyl-prolyl cis-trans isomerase C